MPKTILVADGSVTIRKVVELAFSDTEIRVETAGDGQEALRRIEAVRPDLVLADATLTAPSGYEVCRRVKASGHAVPVVLLIGTFEPFDPARARECGADDHLVKPFESGFLVDKVSELLARAEAAGAGPAAETAEDELEEVFDHLAAAADSAERAPECAPVVEEGPVTPATPVIPPEDAPRARSTATETVEVTHAFPTERNLTPQEIDAIARAVVERLSADVLREIAWEVVPELADLIIRERIRQLEQDD